MIIAVSIWLVVSFLLFLFLCVPMISKEGAIVNVAIDSIIFLSVCLSWPAGLVLLALIVLIHLLTNKSK